MCCSAFSPRVALPAVNALPHPQCLVLQEAGGDWPQQHISGVFNRNCMITYANYR